MPHFFSSLDFPSPLWGGRGRGKSLSAKHYVIPALPAFRPVLRSFSVEGSSKSEGWVISAKAGIQKRGFPIKLGMTILSFSTLYFLFSFTPAHATYNIPPTDENGYFLTQTLVKAKSPYVIPSPCGIKGLKAGRTWTIEPGVVIKFDYVRDCGYGLPANLGVGGTLDAQGTADEPIIFTSIRDDSVAGDTNGDGASSTPARGDWGSMQIGGMASATIRNVIIRYGGFSSFGMVNVSWSFVGSLNLSNIEIAYGSGYGLTTFVPLAIHNSSFHDNSRTGAAINSLGLGGGPSPLVDATNNWWGSDSGPTVASNPAGTGDKILGNVLYDPWIGKYVKPDPVIIIPGILGSAEKNGVWLIDPWLHTYDNLIDTLIVNGYVLGQDLFVFPYDWRRSNVLTAIDLKQKINAVKAICNCVKVDLVAHSMGGLVARQYIQSVNYQNDVDQLIFLGTPHLGSPSAYLSWEGGATQSGFDNEVIKLYLSFQARKLGYFNLFDYVRNYPITSVQELLPIYNYLRDKSYNYLRSYPNNYPQNTFLENLNNTSSTLFNSGVRITNFVGNSGASSTINIIRVVNSSDLLLWSDGYPDGFDEQIGDRGLESGSGDGTVSDLSAEAITNDLNKITSGHREIPTISEGNIYKKLTNADASVLVNKGLIRRLFMIRLYSPVDMIITAPDGKRIGKDFATSQEVNEIDGAFYSGFIGDDEYITIPNPLDGEYKVETIGTDNGGEYTVATGLITDQGSSEQDFTAITTPGMITDLNISINNASSTVEVVPVDTEAPIITIASPEARDYTRDEVLIINTTSTDIGTGVLSHQVAFDGKIISDTSAGSVILAEAGIQNSVDLFFEHLGTHTVSVTSTDFVGNIATSSTSFRVIATASSTIADVDRAFNLGWITKKQVRDDLRRDLTRIVKIEKRIDILRDVILAQAGIQNPRNAIRRIERLIKTIDRILAKQLLHELDRYHNKGWLNDSAYNLLTEDINWLLNN